MFVEFDSSVVLSNILSVEEPSMYAPPWIHTMTGSRFCWLLPTVNPEGTWTDNSRQSSVTVPCVYKESEIFFLTGSCRKRKGLSHSTSPSKKVQINYAWASVQNHTKTFFNNLNNDQAGKKAGTKIPKSQAYFTYNRIDSN